MHKILALLVFSFACASARSTAPAHANTASAEREVPSELREYANALVAALRGEGPQTGLVNWQAIVEAGSNVVPEASRSGFMRGALQSIEQSNLLDGIRREVSLGSYVSATIAMREGHTVVRVRDIKPDYNGVSFYDFRIAPDRIAEGATDIFVAASGVWLVAQIQQLASASFEPSGQVRADTRRVFQIVQEMQRAAQQGAWADALRIYDGIEGELRTAPVILALRLDAASHVGDEIYLQLLEESLQDTANAEWVNLMAIDVYAIRGLWNKMREALRTARRTLPDPYWDVLEALTYAADGDFRTALGLAEGAIAADPDLYIGYESALLASSVVGDWQRAERYARSIRDKFGVDLRQLATEEGFEFLPELDAYR